MNIDIFHSVLWIIRLGLFPHHPSITTFEKKNKAVQNLEKRNQFTL